MLNTSIIPARNLQKSYKAIIEEVKAKKRTVVLITNNKPQAALVNLEDLEELNLAKTRKAALEMLKLATDNVEDLKRLPADLRNKTNNILYTK